MKQLKTWSIIAGIAAALTFGSVSAHATAPKDDAPSPPERSNDVEILDPIEPVNRLVFGINDVVDLFLIHPVVIVWQGLMPQPVQTAVSNVFNNLDDVFGGASHVLQGHGEAAANNFGRVIVNTTVGIGGIFDVATGMGLQKTRGDFGQTLGVWGLPAGPYLVLPLLGPSTTRETVGRIGRYYADPRTYADIDNGVRYGLMGLEYIQVRADGQSNDALLDVSSFDKYVFVRNLYLQRRAAMIREGLELNTVQK